jgi:hypothetical protein
MYTETGTSRGGRVWNSRSSPARDVDVGVVDQENEREEVQQLDCRSRSSVQKLQYNCQYQTFSI